MTGTMGGTVTVMTCSQFRTELKVLHLQSGNGKRDDCYDLKPARICWADDMYLFDA